jgi:hypothetical protein
LDIPSIIDSALSAVLENLNVTTKIADAEKERMVKCLMPDFDVARERMESYLCGWSEDWIERWLMNWFKGSIGVIVDFIDEGYVPETAAVKQSGMTEEEFRRCAGRFRPDSKMFKSAEVEES